MGKFYQYIGPERGNEIQVIDEVLTPSYHPCHHNGKHMISEKVAEFGDKWVSVVHEKGGEFDTVVADKHVDRDGDVTYSNSMSHRGNETETKFWLFRMFGG